jgi:hypothetical protein
MTASAGGIAGGEMRIAAATTPSESKVLAAVLIRQPRILGVFMSMILRSMDDEDLGDAASPPT